MKVSKFGGTSLADANQIRKVITIIQSDRERQFVVVSAPGKRDQYDRKITDLLYEWYRQCELQMSSEEIRQIIMDRYTKIVLDLGVNINMEIEFTEISQQINKGTSADYVASRGEYLIGKIVAVALGYEFIDPALCIHFDNHGSHDKDYEGIRSMLQGRRVVIPGFYGSLLDGSIKTFSRGGSDITGAIIARSIGASLYENWTDVSGLLMADPRIVQSPRKMDIVTYRELRELTYMGANVFHEEAMFPVQEAGISTNIRNTNDPCNNGTYIIAEGNLRKDTGVIIGIAGRRDFSVIKVEKVMMNQQIGYVRKILSILEANRISFEHMPSGIDTLSIIIDNRQFNGNSEKIIREIKEECSPDTIDMYPNMAMIAIVGRAMIRSIGVAAKIFTAIANAGINIRMINQGSSEISIMIGIENDDYESAVRAIYGAFVS